MLNRGLFLKCFFEDFYNSDDTSLCCIHQQSMKDVHIPLTNLTVSTVSLCLLKLQTGLPGSNFFLLISTLRQHTHIKHPSCVVSPEGYCAGLNEPKQGGHLHRMRL